MLRIKWDFMRCKRSMIHVLNMIIFFSSMNGSVPSILHEGNTFQGFTCIEMKNGNFVKVVAPSGIICTGGAGRIYSFSTYAYSSTPDGLDMAYRAGMALKDMEFVQFHPTVFYHLES